MLGHHRFASKFNGVSLMAPCHHANSVPYQKSKSWTPCPPQVLRLNTPSPPPPPPPQSFLAFVLVKPESFGLDLSLSSIGFVVVGFGSYYNLIISLTSNTSLNFYKKSLVYAEQFIFQTLTGCLISMHL